MTSNSGISTPLRFFGGAAGAVAPIALFLAGVAWLGLSGAPDERGFWPVLLAALALGLLLARDKSRYADNKGLRESTLVFFASDNGPVTTAWRHWWEVNLYGSTGGLRGRKADLYEGGIREPAIIRWPGVVEPGTVSDAILSAYDVLPTLAKIVGFEVPDDRPIDGEDFSAILSGKSFERERPLYWEFDDDQGFHYALRDGDWKLLANEDLERLELYNLDEDPYEILDRSQTHAQELSRLLEKLTSIARDVRNDPLRPRSIGR